MTDTPENLDNFEPLTQTSMREINELLLCSHQWYFACLSFVAECNLTHAHMWVCAYTDLEQFLQDVQHNVNSDCLRIAGYVVIFTLSL